MQKSIFTRALVLALLFFNSTMMFAQSVVTGNVKDQTGEPLIGVSVLEKGTTNGAITDIDGNFSLKVGQGKTLVFSYIGYKGQEIAVRGSRLNVTLEEENTNLNEVVVVGYGTMRRKDVTSSITTVQAKDLNVGAYSTPAQLLQGKVPGLVVSNTSDPNGSASISLRGASTLREGAMEPYYVIDGVPGASIELVSPGDIESIDVLRDASATAIYGSKAANGVIIVTTKHGSNEGKVNVTYSGYAAWDKAVKTLDMMTASELLSYANANNVDLSAYYDTSNPANTNWQDEVLRTGFTQNHNVSINGGHGKSAYSASINYMDSEGVVRGTGRDRLTARTFVKTSILNDHLDLSIGLNGSIINFTKGPTSTQGKSVLDAMYYYNPLVPVTNDDGSWYSNSSISQNYNPVSMINEDRYKGREKRIQGTAGAVVHLLKGLDWTTNGSYENKQWLWNNYNSTNSQIEPSKNGLAQRQSYQDTQKQIETYLNYSLSLNDDMHRFNLMAGYSWEETKTSDGFGVSVYNFYNDDLTYNNLTMANSMDGISNVESGSLSTLRMISFYGRLNYSYMGKYLLQGTIRRDGSSAFGKNNRWGYFPSVSAAWRIIDENFMKNQNVLSDLKLRAGYGVSGNSLGFDAFSAIETYGATGWYDRYDAATGLTSQYHILAATKNANPDLKWERTAMLNIGLDFGFFRGRLTGTIEYYNKKTTDLIYGYAVSTSRYPYGWMDANVGDISNKGIELTINAVPIQTKNFTWSTSLNLSHNKNCVEKLSNDVFSVDYIDGGNPDVAGGNSATDCVQRITEGSPIGQFYVFEWAGYDSEGKSIFNDYDDDGNLIGTTDSPNNSDRRKHGSAQPKLSLGWNNTFSYKGWSLTAFFNGLFGHKLYNATRNYYNCVTLMQTGKNMLAEVAETQKATDTRAQVPSDRYLENGSFFKLASLTLAYNFKKIGNWIDGLKVYATCNNVFTITDYTGIDPEISLGGLTPGIDWRNSSYPRTRSFLVGVEVNFGGKSAERKEKASNVDYEALANALAEAQTAKDAQAAAERDAAEKDALIKQLRDENAQLKNRKETTNCDYFDQSYVVFFEINKSVLSDTEREHLKRAAQAILAHGDNVKFTLAGNADKDTGTPEINERLAKERAEAVCNLMKEMGVSADKFTVSNDVKDIYNTPELNRCVIIEKQ